MPPPLSARPAPLAALLVALLAACGPTPAPPADGGGAAATPPEADVALVSLESKRGGAADVGTARRDTAARPPLPDGFVRLRDVAPSVAQEIRYTTAFNFVGEPIDGYDAPECILTSEAADALAAVADDLARQDLGLKVYDCYRPQTAVRHFARWTGLRDTTMKEAFYPTEPKGWLFARGYISTRSGHSRGSTVDLTVVRLPAEDAVRTSFPAPPDPLPRCDGAWGERLDEGDLDMGTAYDCLSPLAATDSPGLSAEARRNRDRLRAAMGRRGFQNYSKEWWHFSLRGEPHPGTYFDFPVQ
ncbi:M15 family metallopeptidase [Rubrivirga sp. S365]|uniref:D-alanyl-D-alanine dipeptidase n=1 Tax=Rubrivirga litoralis TaxID=3075598 RepID=A0ABU3BRB6_9BACT|nr:MULTISPECIES: M15 family metallopeptidase [unclassified Rubrivirga]MDT0631830.1 M15 family metallopeptidase [Rubrivirga sp. F394]MDT7856478.1 M15 family metallopeptidase [Rubrivirga sp. S365]